MIAKFITTAMPKYYKFLGKCELEIVNTLGDKYECVVISNTQTTRPKIKHSERNLYIPSVPYPKNSLVGFKFTIDKKYVQITETKNSKKGVGKMEKITNKQGSLLFRYTGRKFWELDNFTKQNGIAVISSIMDSKQDSSKRQETVSLIRQYFEDFTESELYYRNYKKNYHNNTPKRDTTEPAKTPATIPEQKTQPEPETKQQKVVVIPKTPKKPNLPAIDNDNIKIILAKIQAGIKNLYLYGPAGTGKTTICKQIGEYLELPVVVLSCSAGTSPSEIRGFNFPSPRKSIITEILDKPSIIVLDEFTTLDPSVASVANALLANNELESSTGLIKRNENCIIIATSNTVGTGTDRQYVGNNQLDSATLDRFVGGVQKIGYSLAYESQYDLEIVRFIRSIRVDMQKNDIRRVVSTRAIQACELLKKNGIDWKQEPLANWTKSERLSLTVWNEDLENKYFGVEI